MNKENRNNNEVAASAGCARRGVLQPLMCAEMVRTRGIRQEKTEFRLLSHPGLKPGVGQID